MEKKKITRNRPRGRGRRKLIDPLNHPVGVISVDGRATLLHFDPGRPLKSIVIVKRTDHGWKMACEIGMRRRRPYGYALRFWDWSPEAHLSSREWSESIPLIFTLLRRWVTWGTAEWTAWSTFTMRGGARLSRSRGVRHLGSRGVTYRRPRFLLVKIDHRDRKILTLFYQLADHTLDIQRGSKMAATIDAAGQKGRWRDVPTLIARYFPELHLFPVNRRDLFMLALLLSRVHRNHRGLVIRAVTDHDRLPASQATVFRRYLSHLVRGSQLRRFKADAEQLLGENGVLLWKEWEDRRYTVFRFSLDRLTRST